jgi:hypothetical protein
MAARVMRPNEAEPRTSNQLALLLGPKITTVFPITVPRDGSGNVTFTLTCAPDVRAGQQVSLLLGSLQILPNPWSAPASSFTFMVEQAPVGEHLARLRVDGIDSPLIDPKAVPPVFLDKRIIIT